MREVKVRDRVNALAAQIPGIQMLVCTHPSWTSCQYYAVKGKYAWWTRCNTCGIYRSCAP